MMAYTALHDVDIMCQNRKNSCTASRILDQRPPHYGVPRLSNMEPVSSRRLERTQSEPPKSSKKTQDTNRNSQNLASKCSTSQSPSQQSQDSATRYKTELCRPFEETGHCRYGSKCQFAHGVSELRNLNRHPKYKTELCRTFHSTGFCSYGQRCNFIHNDDETAVSTPLKPLEITRPEPISLPRSTNESPESSISGDSPSSSPGYSSHSSEDVFDTGFFQFLEKNPSVFQSSRPSQRSPFQETSLYYANEDFYRPSGPSVGPSYGHHLNSFSGLTARFNNFSINV